MASLTFEGETHDEIVRKVRRWLSSVEGEDEQIGVAEAVERASELTKDALTVVAQAAPGPIGRSEIVRALTRMGYEATDSTKRAVVAGLDALAASQGEGVVNRVEKARNSVVYEMNAAVARQVLRALRP
ncbi:MAG: hypothetical protein ACHQNA_10040 [Acidimicrobiales bacterium]